MAQRITQNERIIRYLDGGNLLSSRTARTKFGVANLRARIDEIRNQEGYRVRTVRTPRGTFYKF